MPWKAADSLKYAKGLSAKQQQVWAKVANEALAKCEADGGTDCEAAAIKQATAAAKRVEESASLLAEAATIKAKAQAFLRGADALLGDKTLPNDLREKIQTLRAALKKRWTDLEGEASADAKASEAAAPAAERAAQLVDELDEALLQADSLDTIRSLVQKALRDKFTTAYYEYSYAWIRDLFADQVVFDHNGKLWQASYTIDRSGDLPRAVLGEPVEVLVAYVPIADLADAEPVPAVESDVALDGDVVPLVETAVRRDGTVPLKIIQAGWGSSGFYPAEVLKRDGPKVFTKGTKSYWNHPTTTEESERPERDLRDLAAELTTNARWEEAGAAGPGLYADAKVFTSYQAAVDELAPHIGVSIRAVGKAIQGEAEGRKGPLIQQLTAARSVDFVTVPGAGGQVVQLFEAARGRALPPPHRGGFDVTEEEARQLRESATAAQTRLTEAGTQITALQTEVARLREGQILRDAQAFVATELAAIEMPTMTRTRLAESLVSDPPVKDGALDQDTYRTRIKERAAAELEYLVKVAGTGGGAIRGMGSSGSMSVTAEDAAKRIDESFTALLGESRGKLAAAGRG